VFWFGRNLLLVRYSKSLREQIPSSCGRQAYIRLKSIKDCYHLTTTDMGDMGDLCKLWPIRREKKLKSPTQPIIPYPPKTVGPIDHGSAFRPPPRARDASFYMATLLKSRRAFVTAVRVIAVVPGADDVITKSIPSTKRSFSKKITCPASKDIVEVSKSQT